MSVDAQMLTFVDTNILVYAYDRSAGQKHSLAVQLMEEYWEHANGCLSIQVLQEFYVTVTSKITNPLDYQTARQIVEDLTHWRLQVPEGSDLLNAIDLGQNYQLSFWEALIVQSAERLGCRRLHSEDLHHGQMYGNVQVINPLREID